LIESCTTPTGRAWVMGIGVNLRQERFDPSLAPIATSVRILSGRDASIPRFCGALIKAMEELQSSEVDLSARWGELSRMPGRTVTLRRGGSQCLARVDGVTVDGHLRLTHSDGRQETLIGVAGVDIDPQY
jgi:biotin-(acetyl-CoA carboxylase) ligase